MSIEHSVERRVAVLGALADPTRLRIVDALRIGDRSPGELAMQLDLPTNLLAHHVRVLDDAGLLRRVRSEADRRRTYLRFEPSSLDELLPRPRLAASRVVFVCTHNSARSQLATALWRIRSRVPVASGGTQPAARIHPGALRVAHRHGLGLAERRPRHVSDVLQAGDLVVSVCDAAHEVLARRGEQHLHWSVPDPVAVGTEEAFDLAFDEVAGRVEHLATTVEQVQAERDAR